MACPKSLNFDPPGLHADQQPDALARATPIHQITSIAFKDTDHAAAVAA